jgi:hypothetical protein
MARGWESKSVEMQMDEMESSRREIEIPVAESASARELHVLELTRNRLLYEIEHSIHPKLKQQKKNALLHIEAKIREQTG